MNYRTYAFFDRARSSAMFELIKSISVSDGANLRKVSVYCGDLTKIPLEHAVDMLVISAFPNGYVPTRSSLIGALDRAGVSVESLAKNKLHDLRKTCFFWVSKPLSKTHSSTNFRQLACFESDFYGDPPKLVGEVFRGLFPFLSVTHDSTVAMPILAAGDQGYSKREMFDAIVKGAVFWMSRGLGISELKIVELNKKVAEEMAARLGVFSQSPRADQSEKTEFDIFLSFSSKDHDAANIAKSVLEQRPDIGSVFDFRTSIARGVAWQEKIDSAISSCRSVVAILTPDYFDSAECKEELSQARLRHKRENGRLLLPVLWRSVDDVALWLQTLNLVDCRESDGSRLATSLERHCF